MTPSDRTNSPGAGGRNAVSPPIFLLLLALLQLALVPLLGGRDIELAPFFRLDSLGVLFATAWTLTLAATTVPLARKNGGRRTGLFHTLIAVDLMLCAYAQNMVVLALGWTLGVGGIWAIHHGSSAPAQARWPLFATPTPLAVAALAVAMNFPAFVPPAGGVAGPWQPLAVVVVALTVLSGTWWRLLRGAEKTGTGAEQAARAPLTALYALAAPYTLAKMLVAAPWHPLAAWLLVLLGMLAVLAGGYVAYASRGQQRDEAIAHALAGISVAGFGIAAGSPLAAAGATWVMLMGLFWIVTGGRRWAEAGALVAVLPGVWMVSQAALETGYGVAAALLLPVCILLAGLTGWYERITQQAWPWTGAIAATLAPVAAAMPQFVLEAMLRPAVRAMPGGVGALASPSIDWGVGMLVRTPQGTVQAAMPATGIALAVFLAAVVLYWLRQLARFAARRVGAETARK